MTGRVSVAACVLFLIGACSGAPPAVLPPRFAEIPTATATASAAPIGIPMPDRTKTPGTVLAVTAADICVPGYASRVRDVSSATKELVYRSYAISTRDPGEYQVDHLIPLQLGGSNDVENLWPLRDEGPGGKAQKDLLETRLHTLVCSGTIDLRTAQDEIASDWYASYLKRVGTHP